MLTLGIETSTDICAVALVDGKTTLGDVSVEGARAHATQLAPLIARLLDEAGRTPADLDVVAVSAGPGSYTGLRIGMSTAKGLCLAVGAELVAVHTPDALALAALPYTSAGTIATVQKSRRGEVYLATYTASRPDPAAVSPVEAVSVDEFPLRLAGLAGLALVGDAGEAMAGQLIDAGLNPNVIPIRASAPAVALIGMRRAAAGNTDNLASTEPAYLSSFVASKPNAIFPPTAS